MKLSQVEWRAVTRTALRHYRQADVAAMAAEMAYNFVFALFPFALFLAALADVVGPRLGQPALLAPVMTTLTGLVGPTIARALQEVLDSQRPSGILSFSALLALGFASNGVATLIKVCNRAYGVAETRPVVVRWLVALGLTFLLALFLLGGFVVLALGGRGDAWLAGRPVLGPVFRLGWFAIRLALALAGVGLALAVLYWQGPNVKQRFRWTIPGAALAALAWGLATAGFGLYVRVLGASTWGQYYGLLVGPVLFLFYLWLTSLVLLLGAMLTAEGTRRYDPATIRDKVADPHKELPGAHSLPHPQAAAEAGVSRQQVTESDRRSRRVATGEPGRSDHDAAGGTGVAP